MAGRKDTVETMEGRIVQGGGTIEIKEGKKGRKEKHGKQVKEGRKEREHWKAWIVKEEFMESMTGRKGRNEIKEERMGKD